ncbi:hypothetical protein Ndes2526B_g08661 [Nannochloris sp. 'desiccata']|nr:putative Tubulin-folding cofactor D [Chlorella desiccata (nom. nud.)]
MDDQDEDNCTATNLSTYDNVELRGIVSKVVTTAAGDALILFPRFQKLITHYQEQPQLLDPVLEPLVRPLAALILQISHPIESFSTDVERQTRVYAISRYIWQIASVRGYKTVLKFLPNEVTAVEPSVALLAFLVSEQQRARGTGDEGMKNWEAQYVMLMWLSLLAMIPFDLAIIDSSLGSQHPSFSVSATAATADTGTGTPPADKKSATGIPPLAANIMTLCRGFLSSPGATREMAAVLAGRMVTRPDMHAALSEFVTWGVAAMKAALNPNSSSTSNNSTHPAVEKSNYDSSKSIFLLPGVTLAFATIFKLGRRDTLVSVALEVLPAAVELLSSNAASTNALVRKLAVKLVQRAGVAFLPQRVAPWRYQHGNRTTIVGVSKNSTGSGNVEIKNANTSAEVAAAAASTPSNGIASLSIANTSVVDNYEEEEEEEHEDALWAADEHQAEAVETAIESMLSALGDRDTVVRWSAAKGLGRLTGRLPRELGDEVVASVLNSFISPVASDSVWHGGCLALAELTRRGLLLPARLTEAVPLVVKALEYDVRRGHCSVGAHVRDAAAYVCWAVARAYSRDTLGTTVGTLAPALITVACFDREVNCRRAAAAAFQECVGRLGAFPHGIAILTAADYFTVSVRTAAYLTVAPYVASFPGYFEPLAWHLLKIKVHHWEKALRELAAKALAALVPLHRSFFLEQAIPYLLPNCLSPVLETRHGAVAAVAELLPALANITTVDGAAGAAAAMPDANVLPEALADQVAEILPQIEKLKLSRGKGGEIMRSAVCRLIETTSSTGLELSSLQLESLYTSACENLHHPSADIQQAAAVALSAFTNHYMNITTEEENKSGFYSPTEPMVDHLLRELLPGTHSVSARRGAALALGQLPGWLLHSKHAQILEGALEDYTSDNRGDVGSWVREAAMSAMHEVLVTLGSDHIAEHGAIKLLAQKSLSQCVRQASERIARVRETAGSLLQKLTPLIASAGIPAAQQVSSALSGLSSEDFATGQALPSLATLVSVPELRQDILVGLAFSIGGLDAQLAEAASEALVDAIAALDTSSDILKALGDDFVAIWSRNVQSSRLALPLLTTAELLLNRTDLAVELRPPSSQFTNKVLQLTLAEISECKDVPRLHAAAGTLCALAAAASSCPSGSRVGGRSESFLVQREALAGALGLLGNRYPKVRRYTAEQLYTTLLAWDIDETEEEKEDNDAQDGVVVDVDAAMELLSDTAWDGSAEIVRPARIALYKCLGMEPSAPSSAPSLENTTTTALNGNSKGAVTNGNSVREDENANYATLIHNIERGL